MAERQGKITHVRADSVIASVYHYLVEEYLFLKTNNEEGCDLSLLSNIRKRTANATGVTELAVEGILKEEKRLQEKQKAQSSSSLKSLPSGYEQQKNVGTAMSDDD